MHELARPENWTVAVTTTIVVLLCVGLHYEVLSGCTRYMPRLIHNRRRRVLVVILVVLATHLIEMWFFAFGYHFLVRVGSGSLMSSTLVAESNDIEGLLDYAYFSAVVYTTVGFGDTIPVGPVRLMTGVEALTGLVMITWSASYTFLEMQRDWPPYSERNS
jgi:hypothetical protein